MCSMASSAYIILLVLMSFPYLNKTLKHDFRYISHQDLRLSVNVFSDSGVTAYSQLLFDVARDQVLIGARDALYRLSLRSLQLLENTTWPAPEEKISMCQTKGQSEQNCHNYIKVLLTDGRRIFTCGTNAFAPICSWREVERIGYVTEWMDGIALCPYNPLASTTAIMTESGEYFVGGPTDFSGSDAAISRSIGAKHTIRTNQYNSLWLNEPQFVGSFETDQFIYFFFREAAVEFMNCGKIIYSRIARVCKNDPGGQVMLKDNWTTFLKARLNCSISGDYPFYFDHIQSTVYVAEESLVYATFTTPENSIAGSAICAFNLTAINAAFAGPFKHQETSCSSWVQHNSHYPEHFMCSSSTSSDTNSLLESSRYQLMDNAVQPLTLDPLYVTQLERFTHLTVDVVATKLHSSVHVIYVATVSGLIKKLTVLPRTRETCLVEVWQPVADIASNPILSMRYLKQTNSIYIGTDREVVRIPSQHCKRHVSRASCLNSMDPYCGWNELEDACTHAPEGDPLSKHWHQSVTACPVLDAAVDGGWSGWSDWAPCLYRVALNEMADECLCQTRQCNNPSPQHGGDTCSGHSIMVTNCTVHGGWTPWSAWSACTATCGIAVKTRKRTCSNPTPAHGGRVCVGQDRTEVLCTENPPCPLATLPPVDGQWTDWEGWSRCSAHCGGGFRQRVRKCDNPAPKNGGQECTGSDIEYEVCNTHACAEQRRHGLWTPWLLVNSSNNEYTERRYKYSCRAPVSDIAQIKISLHKQDQRTCRGGLCSSDNEEEPRWGAWGGWGECSSTCGGGVQKRVRVCEGRGECQGTAIQTRSCNLEVCKGEWGCWSDWESCSVSCGLGVRKRHRVCKGGRCDGVAVEEEPCEGPPCASLLGWENWTVWSLCDDNNEQHRKRKCRSTNPGMFMCQGPNRETRMCMPELANDIEPMGLEIESGSATKIMVAMFFLGLLVGFLIGCVMMVCYYRKKTTRIPSSPHYMPAKQNPYITVPLQDLPTKKQAASTSNSLLNNSHHSTIKSNKFNDYDSATIKRNSHGLNNGHMKDDYYYQ